MATRTNLKTLGIIDPMRALKIRNPVYFDRYVNKEDDFGYNLETYARWEIFFRFLYEDYFKVNVKGIENIPGDGRALLVGNHSGLLPLDGAMITMAMSNMHPSPRRVRYLATDWLFRIPGLGPWVRETGQVRASAEIAEKLLAEDELVGIYPEGVRGIGKPFSERYRMLDFNPGFVHIAIKTQTPIIKVATVGGDEIAPNFINVNKLARLLKMPFFPITTGFPWLPFPLNVMPLPVRWNIVIHKPIMLDYPPEKADDRKLILKIAREIQYDIQRDLNRLLRERKSVFTGWDNDDDDDCESESD